MHVIRCLPRIIGLLALLLALSGCSAVKLGYANAPSLAYWWLNDYVEFSDAQTPKVRDALDRLHQWHRSTELPRYADLLQQMEALVKADITAEQACSLAADIRGRYNALAAQASPDIAAIAITLSNEQIQHLQQRYARSDAEHRKSWQEASAADRVKQRLKQWTERSEMIYGTLDDAQRDWLRQEVTQNLDSSGSNAFLEDRQRRQQATLQALRAATAPDTSPAQAQKVLARYFEQAQTPTNPQLANQRQRQLTETCRTFASLHNRSTPAQREIAVKRLRAYQRDVMELATAR